jgi:type III restriction enzyme
VNESFFERPILNSTHADPARHWELDADGQPTNRIIDNRRRSDRPAGLGIGPDRG